MQRERKVGRLLSIIHHHNYKQNYSYVCLTATSADVIGTIKFCSHHYNYEYNKIVPYSMMKSFSTNKTPNKQSKVMVYCLVVLLWFIQIHVYEDQKSRVICFGDLIGTVPECSIGQISDYICKFIQFCIMKCIIVDQLPNTAYISYCLINKINFCYIIIYFCFKHSLI